MKTLKKIAQAKEVLENNKVDLYYSNDLSYFYWEDFKGELKSKNKMLMLSGRNGVDYIVFANLDDPYFDDDKLEGLSKGDLVDLYREYVYWNCEGLSKKELKEELKQEITIKDYYTKHYEETRWYDLECDYYLAGYSQGDAVRVLNLLPEDDDAYIPSSEGLSNLLFDSVVDGEILIDGIELDFRDYLTNDYNYDKDDFLENFKKLYKGDDRDELLEFLKAELPTQLEYK